MTRLSTNVNFSAIVAGRSCMYILNTKKTRPDPCGTLFLKCRNLLCFSELVTRVELQLLTSFIIIEIMRLSGNRHRSCIVGCSEIDKHSTSLLFSCKAILNFLS